MKWRQSFHPYASVTILFWSLAYVLTRMALPYFSPTALGFLRYMIASVCLLALSLALHIRPPHKKDLIWFAAAGATGFAAYVVLFNVGSSYVTAATSSVIIAIVPVLTALLASFLLGEGLQRYQWAAIAVEFGGILILTLYDGIFTANQGVVWLLGAAVCLSLYNLLQRRLTRTYTALQATTYSILFGTLFLSVFAPASIKDLKGAPPVGLLCLVALGVLSSAVAYLTWSKAMEKAQHTSSVSNYMFITPFLTSLLGVAMLGELPSPATLTGGFIIIGGAVLFHKESLFGRNRPMEHDTTP